MKFPLRSAALAALALALSSSSAFAQKSPPAFNIKDYDNGIQKAIDAAGNAGGGKVVIPAGNYLTGPFHLRTNIDLHIEQGAIVRFSRRYEDYPLVVASHEGHDAVICTSPITGDNLQNVSITGQGTFDGNGDAWRLVKKEKLTDEQWKTLVASGGVVGQTAAATTWYPNQIAHDGIAALRKLQSSDNPLRIEDYGPYKVLLRPALMLLSNCNHVVLDGPTFKNSPGWDLHLYCSDDLTIRNLTVFNEYYAQNGDGMDIDSCRNVTVSDCNLNAGDDVICLKSGRDEAGRKLNRPTENVTVTHCIIGHGHGGIAIGSEMSGGVRHVSVSHCVMDGTDAGLRFKSTRGRGGIVEDINISDIQMSNIKQNAIEFSMYYMVRDPDPKAQPVSEGTPQFRRFNISNIRCNSTVTALSLRGLPEMAIQDISIANATINAQNAGEIVDAKNIMLSDVHIHAASGGEVKLSRVTNLMTSNVQGVSKGLGL